MDRDAAPALFFDLTRVRSDLFVISGQSPQGQTSQEIRPGGPVPDDVAEVIANGMPVPHYGAMLGWVADHKITAILVVRTGPLAAEGEPVADPAIQVMLMSGTRKLDWPPFTASPLGDGRFWDYVERGHIVDIAPLLSGCAGRVFWVPRQAHGSARGAGCLVVTQNLRTELNLRTEEYWLPAGAYVDHWVLREGISPPQAGHLLALPGVEDLAPRLQGDDDDGDTGPATP